MMMWNQGRSGQLIPSGSENRVIDIFTMAVKRFEIFPTQAGIQRKVLRHLPVMLHKSAVIMVPEIPGRIRNPSCQRIGSDGLVNGVSLAKAHMPLKA